ncbi:hypothetical protein NG798_16860 [Ancylothrix sp. C2]|uniref:hypothetical protein n=1 Tax=Ancylothrix sp. D3o TaxID=2953691 RepID=UPI0021BA6D56|nr:hypothetical protein [Ancylothrix sp. D3o]MCT7951475.1 hypothetical protein [Ancylothrix sp. D3o]
MSPAEFEYLIKKTVTYLEFHSDDSAKELTAEWGKILAEIQAIKKKKASKKAGPHAPKLTGENKD